MGWHAPHIPSLRPWPSAVRHHALRAQQRRLSPRNAVVSAPRGGKSAPRSSTRCGDGATRSASQSRGPGCHGVSHQPGEQRRRGLLPSADLRAACFCPASSGGGCDRNAFHVRAIGNGDCQSWALAPDLMGADGVLRGWLAIPCHPTVHASQRCHGRETAACVEVLQRCCFISWE